MGWIRQGFASFVCYLRNIAEKEGVSVFVSSHMLSEIEFMCDRIAIIQNGKLIDMRNGRYTRIPLLY